MNMKYAIYLVLLLTVGVFLGLAIVKLNHTQTASPANSQTQTERIQTLEKSSAITSPAAKNFIKGETAHRSDTSEVLGQDN
ncbi:MAG: hypothetical protein ABFD46_05285 [Armatimonadota bacterium]